MHASDVMTTNVVTVSEDTPVEEVARVLLTRRISAAPVIDADNRLVGIVSEGDLVRRPETDDEARSAWWLESLAGDETLARAFAVARGRRAKDVMSTGVITANETDSLADIARTLEKSKIKRVPIVRHGKLVGIVSRANLLHGLAAGGFGAKEERPETQATRDEPAGQHSKDDRSIRATILNTIHNDIGVDSPINVIVRDGVVDLWGGVETQTQRQAVTAAAESAPNVRTVNDHLTVMPSALRLLLKHEA